MLNVRQLGWYEYVVRFLLYGSPCGANAGAHFGPLCIRQGYARSVVSAEQLANRMAGDSALNGAGLAGSAVAAITRKCYCTTGDPVPMLLRICWKKMMRMCRRLATSGRNSPMSASEGSLARPMPMRAAVERALVLTPGT